MKKVVILIVLLGVTGGGIFFYMNSKEGIGIAASYPKTYRAYKSDPEWRGGETGTILPSVYFIGMARQAYESAATIPDVLDHLYCFCYCAEEHGHKSLRTCFTDDHGAACDICMLEAIRARQLYDKGYSIKEIRANIEKEYYRPYRSH